MSLQVWLPLTGDVHNQGISSISATGANISVNTAGKIGSCYSFNGSSSYIELSSALCSNATTEFSYTCWVKFNSTATGCLFSNRIAVDSNGVTLFVNSNGNILYDIGKERHTKAYAFSTGTWYHLTFTYKKGATEKIYVNGNEVYSASTSGTMTGASATKCFIGASQNTSTTVNANYLNGYLNDVRIYDHCLSAAEVHEIAQGLVVHYKLDDLTNGVIDSSGYGHNGTIVGSPTLSSDTPRYSTSMAFNGTDTAINCGRSFHIQGASEITFSCWAYVDNWNDGTYKYYLSSQQSGGIILNSLNSNVIRARVSAYTAEDLSTYAYINADCGQASTGVSTGWHMLTGVYTTSDIKLYIDGELKKTTTTVTYGLHFHNTAYMYIGAESNGTSPADFLNGKVSDVRIYYTALPAADILSLYHTGAKVDNLGGFHTFQLNQEGPTPKILKVGTTQHANFIETAQLNAANSISYKPAANTNNSCLTGTLVDYSAFADLGRPLAIQIEFDLSWSSFAAGTGGTFRIILQGQNRKIADNAFAWEGTNYSTQNIILTDTIKASASGTAHISKTNLIPASWFGTYNASYFGIRTDYSNGNGIITLSNIKITPSACAKITSNEIYASEFIEL